MLFTVNTVGPKKWGSMIPNFEHSTNTKRVAIKDDHQLQGSISIPRSEEHLGSMYPTVQCSEIVGFESNPPVAERHNLTPGVPVEITAVSISAPNSNIPAHEYTASAISGGSNNILNTAIHIGASEQSSQERLLKGRVQFNLVLQIGHSHRSLEPEVSLGFLPLGRNILASNSDNVGSSDLSYILRKLAWEADVKADK